VARRSILSDEETSDIDLSPMIDCIFILLIFFIVTTVFVDERGMPVNKPDAAVPTSVEEKESVVLEITAENGILCDGVEIGIPDVANRVRAGLSDPQTPVVIRAHEKARHGTFVAVWDAARRGGAQLLSFTTVH
jgi:biopolymer transport protein ExbD